MSKRSVLGGDVPRLPPGNGGRKPCGICEPNPPRYLCPTCPRRALGQHSDDAHGWDRAIASDPALGRVQLRNAKAARMLAITPENHVTYPEWLAEYRSAGDELSALYAERRAQRIAAGAKA